MSSMHNPPHIPVIVLNWNGWEDTFRCLQSLARAQGVDAVWLVDNASEQDRAGEAARFFPGLRVLRLGDNHGWAGGYNRALHIAREEGYPLAYLLNNDAEVDPGFLCEAAKVYDSLEGIASVGSCIRFLDGSVKFDGKYHPQGGKHYHLQGESMRPSSFSNGSGMLINLSAFDEVGAFDEMFFCYGEEHEWCRRAVRLGYRHCVALRSVVWHKSEGSDTNSNAAYYRGRNLYLLSLKSHSAVATREFLRITYSLYRRANEARRLGQKSRQHAMLQAIHDGVRLRFGKRPTWRCPVWLRPIAYSWPFPTGFFHAKRGARTAG